MDALTLHSQSTQQSGYKKQWEQIKWQKTCMPTEQSEQKMRYPLLWVKNPKKAALASYLGKQGHSCTAKGDLATSEVNKMERSGTPITLF